MGVETKITYICDGCGKKSHSADFNDGHRCGSGQLLFKGHNGGKSHDGSWGGSSFDKEMLLCFECADKILATIVSLPNPSRGPK